MRSLVETSRYRSIVTGVVLCTALSLVTVSHVHAADKGDDDKGLSIAISVPTEGTERRIDTRDSNSHFHVVVTNRSDREQRLFQTWNSWGYFNLTFDVIDEEPNFIIGASVFFVGWGVNLWSDQKLLSLRKSDETVYRIPQGGLFRWVSCPNFLGETIQWMGWAAMCWNLAGLSFAVWTIANLVPRALAHHRWYAAHFDDYPSERTAIVPKLL